MEDRYAAFFVVYIMIYILNIGYFYVLLHMNRCNYHEPGAIVENMTRLPVYYTIEGCTFRISWRPLHTPWYGFSPSDAYFDEPVHRTLRMPCPPEPQDPPEGMRFEGCYPNTLRVDVHHPPEFEHYDNIDDRNDMVTDIFFFRASAYIMMSPLFIVAAYALIKSIEMARNKVRSWIAAWEQRRYHELAEMPQMPQMPQIRSETGGV
jgi:hypothetical protein